MAPLAHSEPTGYSGSRNAQRPAAETATARMRYPAQVTVVCHSETAAGRVVLNRHASPRHHHNAPG